MRTSQVRGLFVAVAVAGGVVAGPTVGGVAAHAATANPVLQTVALKMVIPSTMGSNGSFQIQAIGRASSPVKICAYQVERYSSATGNWANLGQFSGASMSFFDNVIPASGSYEYGMNVQDCNGSWSGWAYSVSTAPTTTDDTAFAFSGLWQRSFDTSAYGGSEAVGQQGAQATITTGFYNAAIVGTTQSSGYGTFNVTEDGVLVGKNISTRAAGATHYRQVLFKSGSSIFGTHTIVLQVVSGKVTLDAVATLAAGTNLPNWTHRLPTTNPSGRGWSVMAFDAGHNQTVLFGGQGSANGNAFVNDTWTWDGNNWTQHFPVSNPPARSNASMAYDAAHGQIVLFGGSDFNTIFTDTWTWDGNNWTQRSPTSNPPGRNSAGMAYDSARGQVILFSGGYLNDTWTWDGSNWTQHFPASSPPFRFGTSMVFDSIHAQAILFGGSQGGTSSLSDTWTWDGSNWTQRVPPTSPLSRVQPRMAFDNAQGRTVLFGGYSYSLASNLGDTWTGTAATGRNSSRRQVHRADSPKACPSTPPAR